MGKYLIFISDATTTYLGGDKIKRKLPIIAVACIMLLTTTSIVQAGSPSLNPTQDSDTTTCIVGFNDSNNFSAMDDQINTFTSQNCAQVLQKYNDINAIEVKIPKTAVKRLKSLNNVKYVENDIIFHANLEQAAPIIGAPEIWDCGYTGNGVRIALIDSGIDASHPDMKGKITGWIDLVSNKTTPYDNFGHGSHCAGIIAGTGAASKGRYKGIAPDAQLIGIKVLNKDGSGRESTILSGIEYAMNSNASVISMSLGSDEHSEAIHAAVEKAIQKGKIVVCAAGNSGPNECTIGCPSDVKEAITVGATDKNDSIAQFSSRGPLKDGTIKPDICAPGKDIVSIRASGTNDGHAIDQYYLSMSGTSMACPMVSGTVALLVQKNPKLTPAKAKEILEKSAEHLGSTVPNNNYGYGRINVKNAIDYMNGNFTPTPSPTPRPKNPPYPTPTPKPSPCPIYPTPINPNPIYPEPGYPYPTYPIPGYNPGQPSYCPGYPNF